MARKNSRKNRNTRKNRKTMKGGAENNVAAPTNNTAATPTNNTATAPTNNTAAVPANQTGGRRRGHRKSHKLSSGAAKWRDHMMKVYREMKSRNPATKLGDAMRAAKKSYNA
jgi:hypothetical protein